MPSRMDESPVSGTSDSPPRTSRWSRLLQALPLIAGLATFGFFFVDKNREARTVLKSGRGILAMTAVVGGYALIAFVLRRWVRWAWVSPVVLTAVVLGLAAWIVRPYYADTTANRQLVTGRVDDLSQMAPPVLEPSPEPVPPPSAPVRISNGALKGLGHDASGSISLIRNPDGSMVVRFENFDIENVPDPRVHLAPGADVQRAGGVSLGHLSGNRGRVLDYAVPPGTDAGPGWTVLIWCRAFSVPVANATQAPV